MQLIAKISRESCYFRYLVEILGGGLKMEIDLKLDNC